MILIIKQVHLLVILKSLNMEMLVLKILYSGSNVYNQKFYSNFHLVSIDSNNRALELNKHNPLYLSPTHICSRTNIYILIFKMFLCLFSRQKKNQKKVNHD